MKKLITIGDIHGRKSWQEIIDRYDDLSELYKIIFIGDYVDSFTLSNEEIEQNLLNIIEFKKKHPDKVILLLGNHDLHYIISKINPTGGYRGESYHSLNKIFIENIDWFDMCFQIENYIWSHAGITQTYYNYVLDFIKDHRHSRFIETNNYANLFNSLLRINEFKHLWKTTEQSGGVRDFPSLEWSRPIDVLNDNLEGYIQIVGHTAHDSIIYHDHLIIVDNLGSETIELITHIKADD